MFSSLFDLDNPILKFLSRLVDLVVLNVIFIVSCIPVVTIGAALTALYYVCITDWDTQNAHILSKYVKSFKENFKQSTIIWVIMLLAGVVLGTDLWFAFVQWQSSGSTVFQVILVVCAIAVIVYLMIFTFVWPLQAKFDNKIVVTFRNAFVMSCAHLPKTIILWCLFGIMAYCVYEYLVMKAMLIALAFSVLAFIQSILFRAAFQPYLEDGRPQEGEVWTHETDTDVENSYADAKLEAARLAAEMEEDKSSDNQQDAEENKPSENQQEAEENNPSDNQQETEDS
ncbi:MAG: DUF624 domain-containing protein [Lachnospiraceae bacterium]|nr:DUF624 domain-containing protein [Lachnospiraceae bacterium]